MAEHGRIPTTAFMVVRGVLTAAASAAIVAAILVIRTLWSLLAGPLARWIPGGSPAAGTLPWRSRVTIALASTRGRLTL